jgi:hypothetical protein
VTMEKPGGRHSRISKRESDGTTRGSTRPKSSNAGLTKYTSPFAPLVCVRTIRRFIRSIPCILSRSRTDGGASRFAPATSRSREMP